ncbi:DUF6520 family protein [Chitinophaga niabensis]|uniref:DUF6520 family protein n=1 Tax=Chitinophaga niabensis TaxID=536979 RepID=UPI001160E5F4|nr:DUF6520 family protein [Chitinophaga niabensis]
MNKKSFFLVFSTFLLAISTAFASNIFIAAPELGYSKQIDVECQPEPCKLRGECPGGPFICTATFVECDIVYVNIALYGLNNPSDPTSCTVQLTQENPN